MRVPLNSLVYATLLFCVHWKSSIYWIKSKNQTISLIDWNCKTRANKRQKFWWIRPLKVRIWNKKKVQFLVSESERTLLRIIQSNRSETMNRIVKSLIDFTTRSLRCPPRIILAPAIATINSSRSWAPSRLLSKRNDTIKRSWSLKNIPRKRQMQ